MGISPVSMASPAVQAINYRGVSARAAEVNTNEIQDQIASRAQERAQMEASLNPNIGSNFDMSV